MRYSTVMATADAVTDRRARLLDEALAMLARSGLAAVTHRSVENAAGAPHGSVTYWFGSRDGLVDAIVDRLVAECETEVRAIAEGLEAAYATGAAPDLDRLAGAISHWMDELRELHLARLELELAAVRDERIRARMHQAALLFWGLCDPIVRALGSDDPERDRRAMGIMVDGILLDRLARPHQPREVLVAAIRRLLGSWAAGG